MSSEVAPPDAPSVGDFVNINVGVLGHVDSGKTSLVRALSTKLSTASLDKHPQSKERGITLDLGFSAFTRPLPVHLREQHPELKHVQYTLVDCPGHASLIRTVIGGAQIIDRMILVIDITKGIQTQTAECLVIGEILTDDLTIVLNKVDLIPEAKRSETIAKVSKTVLQALDGTRFKDSVIVPVSAAVGGDGKAGVGENSSAIADKSEGARPVESVGLEALVTHLEKTTLLPYRGENLDQVPLYFAIDHCFPIKGQGTVLTGTVLNGIVKVGQTVELPQLKEERKVKSIQMFRTPVQEAKKGDRAALCVTNLNSKLLERGVVATPGSAQLTTGVIALVRKVKYFPMECTSKSKIHITVGHSTTIATVTFFGSSELKNLAAKHVGKSLPEVEFDGEKDYAYDEQLLGGGKAKGGPFLFWALLEFETPLICQAGSMVIGSRLDMDINTKNCRIAFYGRVSKRFFQPLLQDELASLRVFKIKEREGVVDRVVDKSPGPDGKVQNVIVRSMFSKDSDLQRFLGKKVYTAEGDIGRLESSFGKTGKLNVYFPDGAKIGKNDKVILRFKHMVFASQEQNKKIIQDNL